MITGPTQVETESSQSLQVRVLVFGAAREMVGSDQLELSLSAPATAESALREILAVYPELRRFGRSLLFAVNQEYASPGMQVREGDELAIFPPVSGGSPHDRDFYELTAGPINVGETARRVVVPECGATVTLDGYVREWTRGRKTSYLVYEAYAPMAISELRRLGWQAHELFDISHIGIVHRTGRLEVGETSVVIAVSAPHRRAAFQACEWAIKELKRTVPIWKKEFFEDGEIWVEGEGAPQELLKSRS
jgi:molybdopterin converting factor subunit 1